MHELCTAFVSEKYGMARSRAAGLVTVVCSLFGAACAMSFGPWKDMTFLGMGVFDWFDFLTAKFIMPLGGLLITAFVGWYMDREMVESQLTNWGTLRIRSLRILMLLIRWVAPIGVGLVFLNELLPLLR